MDFIKKDDIIAIEVTAEGTYSISTSNDSIPWYCLTFIADEHGIHGVLFR